MSGDVAEGFATVDDLVKRWRELSPSERGIAVELLADATSLIKDLVPAWPGKSSATLRRVCCAMVRRAMSAPDGFDGAISATVTAGPFTRQAGFSAPVGDLYLSKAERQALGVGRSAAFSVDLSGLAGGGANA